MAGDYLGASFRSAATIEYNTETGIYVAYTADGRSLGQISISHYVSNPSGSDSDGVSGVSITRVDNASATTNTEGWRNDLYQPLNENGVPMTYDQGRQTMNPRYDSIGMTPGGAYNPDFDAPTGGTGGTAGGAGTVGATNPDGSPAGITPEGGWDMIQLVYGWLPEDALQVFYNQYVESGNADAGWTAIRKDARYEQWFPGNLTEDGRVRYSEERYAATVESYRDVYRAYNLNESLLNARIGDLIRGEVSPNEFAGRVQTQWERVVSASAGTQQYWATMEGVPLTVEALLAGALDPTVGTAILEGKVKVAEVGGQALDSGFSISIGRVEELVAEGMNKATADKLYGDAERLVPLLNTLAQRHNDPDSDFDIEEFTQAEFFRNPEENLRIQRMMAQERSMFRSGLSARRDQTGALTGLLAR